MSERLKRVLERSARVLPPRRGQGIAVVVSSTPQVYDLRDLEFDGKDDYDGRYVTLTLAARTATIYYYFSETDDTDIDPAIVIDEGDPLEFDTRVAIPIDAGAFHTVEIDRQKDKYLVLVTAGGGATLRLWPSSVAGII